MPRDAVLDASALLALLNGEPGADAVAAFIPGALISALNLAEVIGKLLDGGMSLDAARGALRGLGLRVADVDEALAWEIGALRTSTRALGLSLGDRGCLALGRRTGLPVVTADRAWTSLDLGVTLEVIR